MDKQFGKFSLLEKIATGGMGEIFLARHVDYPADSPPVALKRILPSQAKDARFIRVFFNEAKIVSGLDHENLVHVIDFGKEQGSFYMLMEYVDGINVDQLAAKAKEQRESWSVAHGVEIVRQALRGMHSAHEQMDKQGRDLGIVHMDLNPKNMMISTEGRVKVLDFGISRVIYEEDHKAFNALRGTYAYMSPEQCREEEVDRRSDLFTLGIVLYELTTLSPLFGKQPSEFMIFKAITEGIVPPPSNIDKDYPTQLEKVIFKALEVDKEKRYADAMEFEEDLASVASTYNLDSGPESIKAVLSKLLPKGIEETKKEVEEIKTSKGKSDEGKPAEIDSDREKESPNTSIEIAPMDDIEKRTDEPEDELPVETERVSSGFGKWIWPLFGLLMVAMISSFGFVYHQKTSWMQGVIGPQDYKPETGILHVMSIPEGATVFIDMKKQEGTTPLKIDGIEFERELIVEVVMAQYDSTKKTIEISDSAPVDAVFVELKSSH